MQKVPSLADFLGQAPSEVLSLALGASSLAGRGRPGRTAKDALARIPELGSCVRGGVLSTPQGSRLAQDILPKSLFHLRE